MPPVSALGLPSDVFAMRPHPACELFPLLPEGELAALADDIRQNGLTHPIVFVPGTPGEGDALILDGRNRLAACKLAGKQPRFEPYRGSDPVGYTISCNVRRRHLTAEQKRAIIGVLLKADPTASDRRIAAQAGVDHKTAGAVRDDLEGRGEIPHEPTRTDAAGRQQPA